MGARPIHALSMEGKCSTTSLYPKALYLVFVCFIFETESFYVALAWLVLGIQLRLAWDSWQSSCLSLLSAGIASKCHYLWLPLMYIILGWP